MSKRKKDAKEGKTVTAETTAETTVEMPVETPMPEGTEGAATLTMKDLQAIGRIFELATQRGAFRANEMTTVGKVYDKLNQFLAQVAASQEAAEGTEGTGGTEGTEAVQGDAEINSETPETSEA